VARRIVGVVTLGEGPAIALMNFAEGKVIGSDILMAFGNAAPV